MSTLALIMHPLLLATQTLATQTLAIQNQPSPNLSLLWAALVGGGAGVVGSMLLVTQRHKRFKQRLLQQIRQEMDRFLQSSPAPLASHPDLQEQLDRLTQEIQASLTGLEQSQRQIQKQLQGEVGALRRDFNQLRGASGQASSAESATALPPELAALKQHFDGELAALKKQIHPLQLPQPDGQMAVQSVTRLDGSLTDPATEAPEKGDPGLENVESVIHWLTMRNVKVESYHQPEPYIDKLFNRFAIELGNHYGSLSGLSQQMKKNVGKGSRFVVSLADKSQNDIRNCTRFCSNLKDASLLSFYRYDKSTKSIQATLQKREDLTAFLTGKWFERFVYRKVADYWVSQQLSYKCLMNAQVKFDNGDRYELDFLFLVEGQPLWIECKTSANNPNYLAKYSNHAELLKIPKSRALLVILDISDIQATEWTSLWKVTVVNQDQLISAINQALNSPFEQAEAARTASPGDPVSLPSSVPLLKLVKRSAEVAPSPASLIPVSIEENSNSTGDLLSPDRRLAALFTKRKLIPHPDHRMAVIQELNKRFADAAEPINFKQVKEYLSERLGIPKGKVQDILKAIFRAGGLLGENGKTISNFNEPIVELLSSDSAWLESQCIEQYAAIVLASDLNFFDLPQNRQAFERIVGSAIPDAATLKLLKNELQSLTSAEEEESVS